MVAALHAIPDWTIPYLDYMNRGELPAEETLARQIIRRSKSMTILNGSYIIIVFQEQFSDAFLLKKVVRFCEKFMKGIAVTTPVQSCWLPKHFATFLQVDGAC